MIAIRWRWATGLLLCMVAVALVGCETTRKLDELSSSYERLATEAGNASAAEQQGGAGDVRNGVRPPSGALGSAFLVVGRDALAAAADGRADPRTRIALYRIAAS